MSKSTSTDKVLLWATAGLLAYEAYTLVNKTPRDTISEGVWKNVARRPLLPFTFGMLVGHWIWQSQDVYDEYRKADL